QRGLGLGPARVELASLGGFLRGLLLERLALFVVEQAQLLALASDQLELALGLLGALEGAAAELAIQPRARHALEQLGPLAAAGLEERRELALAQEHRAAELIEVEAEAGLDGRERVALAIARDDPAAITDLHELHLLGLDAAVGPVAGASDLPAGSPASHGDAAKDDLGPGLDRDVLQEAAHVRGPHD